jgi:hypothetical protein
MAACLPLALLAGCGRSHSTDRGAVASVPAEVVVTFNGPMRICQVSRLGDANNQSMPCLEVPSYLTKTLKLRRGSWKTIPDVNVVEFDQLMSELKAAGYRLTPGIHVDFLTEPTQDHP